MEKKQTAVLMLVSKLPLGLKQTLASIILDALAMEREQIEDAWGAGSYDGGILGASDYYIQTYL